tara:strand:+ start:422 stop:1354 length:933 start_codon:yes stop_codon:yes gene_type:complete
MVKINILSNKIERGGSIIEPSNEKDLSKIDRNKVIEIFEDKGVILFRNFNLDKDTITEFTDLFTQQYANDANRRKARFKNSKMHDVDPGKMEMPLHSEASYSPSWPEIVWFYCNQAPKKSGQTTICDGRLIYKNLCAKTKNFFLSNQIVYNLKIPYERNENQNKENKQSKLKPWYIENPGVSDCFIDFKNKVINLKQKRYAVIETRKLNEVAFVNHLQIILDRDPQILGWSLEDGSKIPDEIMSEIREVSNKLIVDIDWENNDLCMIDNKRIMHGRRKILDDEKRDIINLQSLKASFGYGSTMRKQINSS